MKRWTTFPLLSFFPVQMESGGTVLSTNWKDVGKRTVEMSPPDDVEFKEYWAPPSLFLLSSVYHRLSSHLSIRVAVGVLFPLDGSLLFASALCCCSGVFTKCRKYQYSYYHPTKPHMAYSLSAVASKGSADLNNLLNGSIYYFYFFRLNREQRSGLKFALKYFNSAFFSLMVFWKKITPTTVLFWSLFSCTLF